MFGIERRAAKAARRAGLLSAGLLFCLVGTAFLTTAVWLALLPIVGAATTAIILALLYLGAGAIIIGLALHSRPEPDRPHHAAAPETAPGDGPPIVQAFMYGLQAGSQSRSHRASRPD